MGTIHLCIEVNNSCSERYSQLNPTLAYQQALDELFAAQCQKYQNLFQFLYNHPSCRLSVTISGRQLDWFARHRRELLLVLSELAGRKQVEVLGGAYYEPLLPTILPVDRVKQVELFTTALRRHTGRRPRGMVIPNNAWDPSLVSSLKTCGMDFVLMDSELIPRDENSCLPCIVQEQGKLLYVLGQNRRQFPFSASGEPISPMEYIDGLERRIAAACPDAEHPLVCFSLSLEQIDRLLASRWLEQLDACIGQDQFRRTFQWTLPSRYVKDTQHFRRTYIPAGVLVKEPGRDSATSSMAAQNSCTAVLTPYEYLLREPRTYQLYSKMMYVSSLVGQSRGDKSRGDKSRKNMVRDLLMEAQAGEAYLLSSSAASRTSRKYAYRSLLHSEKNIREYSGFSDSVTDYDYDADGLREYICQFHPFNAYIQRRGGCIFEFDVFQTFTNYAGTGSGGASGLFLDYFLDDYDSPRNELFSRQLYREREFDGRRRDIQLWARGNLGGQTAGGERGSDQQVGGGQVSLKKNYAVSPDGILVQYIIKNEGHGPLRRIFAVESNIALEAAGTDRLDTELIYGQLEELQVFHSTLPADRGAEVSQVRFSDQELSFVFSLNEQATLQMKAADGNLTVTLCWQLEIPPQREVEKNISFTVVPRKTTKSLR